MLVITVTPGVPFHCPERTVLLALCQLRSQASLICLVRGSARPWRVCLFLHRRPGSLRLPPPHRRWSAFCPWSGTSGPHVLPRACVASSGSSQHTSCGARALRAVAGWPLSLATPFHTDHAGSNPRPLWLRLTCLIFTSPVFAPEPGTDPASLMGFLLGGQHFACFQGGLAVLGPALCGVSVSVSAFSQRRVF